MNLELNTVQGVELELNTMQELEENLDVTRTEGFMAPIV